MDNALCQCKTEDVEEKCTKGKNGTEYTIARIYPYTFARHFSSFLKFFLKKIDLIKGITTEKNSVNKIDFTSKPIEFKLF